MSWEYCKTQTQRLATVFLWALSILLMVALCAFIGVTALEMYGELIANR